MDVELFMQVVLGHEINYLPLLDHVRIFPNSRVSSLKTHMFNITYDM